MTDWMSGCFQTASCIWWPFDTQREFVLVFCAIWLAGWIALQRPTP